MWGLPLTHFSLGLAVKTLSYNSASLVEPLLTLCCPTLVLFPLAELRGTCIGRYFHWKGHKISVHPVSMTMVAGAMLGGERRRGVRKRPTATDKCCWRGVSATDLTWQQRDGGEDGGIPFSWPAGWPAVFIWRQIWL